MICPKRRVQGLKKKTHELATLCGVDAFLVCYEDGGSDQHVIPITYPENPDEVRRIMKRYRDQTDMQQNNRCARRQHPAEDTHKKKRSKTAVAAADSVHVEGDFFFDGFNPVQLEEILKSVDSKLEQVNELLIEKSCETENFADASNQDWAATDGCIDVYDFISPPPMIDLGHPMLMPCSCSLQSEERNQWEPSSPEIECTDRHMIRILRSLKYGDCFPSGCGMQFVPSISPPYSCNSM
ncbi:hypothetical protein NE237_009129 [Protea cynaroides]|uniref:MADS-box domain-containing protein n=1 Tax=Protea cynaroides TaxID=273540 RepID=A0A9Q0KXD3_9MAGN|nr:hypothetical protein NE237_009129 [Protea cynaroides]